MNKLAIGPPFLHDMLLVIGTVAVVCVALPIAIAAIRPWRSWVVMLLAGIALVARSLSIHVPNNFYTDLPGEGSFRFSKEYSSLFYEAVWRLAPHPNAILFANIACGVLAVVLVHAVASKLPWFAPSAALSALTVAIAPFFVRLTASYELHPFGLLCFLLAAWFCVTLPEASTSRARHIGQRLLIGAIAWVLVATRVEFASMTAALWMLAIAARRTHAEKQAPDWRTLVIDGCTILGGGLLGAITSPGARGPANSPFEPSAATLANLLRYFPHHLQGTFEARPLGLFSLILAFWVTVTWLPDDARRSKRVLRLVLMGVPTYLMAATRLELAPLALSLLLLAAALRRVRSEASLRLQWKAVAMDACVLLGCALAGALLAPPWALSPDDAGHLQASLADASRQLPSDPPAWLAALEPSRFAPTGERLALLRFMPLTVPVGVTVLFLLVRRYRTRVLIYALLMLSVALPYTICRPFTTAYVLSFADLCMARYALAWALIPVVFSSMALHLLLEKVWRPALAVLAIPVLLPSLPATHSLYSFQAEFVFLQKHRALLQDKCLVVGWQKEAPGDLWGQLSFPNTALMDVVVPERVRVFSATTPPSEAADPAPCKRVYFETSMSQLRLDDESNAAAAQFGPIVSQLQELGQQLKRNAVPLVVESFRIERLGQRFEQNDIITLALYALDDPS